MPQFCHHERVSAAGREFERRAKALYRVNSHAGRRVFSGIGEDAGGSSIALFELDFKGGQPVHAGVSLVAAS